MIDFMSGSSSWYVTCFQFLMLSSKTTQFKGEVTTTIEFPQSMYHPVKFGGHRYCSKEDIMVLVCHVI